MPLQSYPQTAWVAGSSQGPSSSSGSRARPPLEPPGRGALHPGVHYGGHPGGQRLYGGPQGPPMHGPAQLQQPPEPPLLQPGYGGGFAYPGVLSQSQLWTLSKLRPVLELLLCSLLAVPWPQPHQHPSTEAAVMVQNSVSAGIWTPATRGHQCPCPATQPEQTRLGLTQLRVQACIQAASMGCLAGLPWLHPRGLFWPALPPQPQGLSPLGPGLAAWQQPRLA